MPASRTSPSVFGATCLGANLKILAIRFMFAVVGFALISSVAASASFIGRLRDIANAASVVADSNKAFRNDDSLCVFMPFLLARIFQSREWSRPGRARGRKSPRYSAPLEMV